MLDLFSLMARARLALLLLTVGYNIEKSFAIDSATNDTNHTNGTDPTGHDLTDGASAPTAPPVDSLHTTPPFLATDLPETDSVVTSPTRPMVWLIDETNLATEGNGVAQISAKLTIDARTFSANLDNINLLFTDVPQDSLTYRSYYNTNQTLGFTASGSSDETKFEMSCDGARATVGGIAHSDLYERLNDGGGYYSRQYHKKDSSSSDSVEDDFSPTQTVAATADVELTSADEVDSMEEDINTISTLPPINGTRYMRVRIRIVLWIHPTQDQRRRGILPVRIVIVRIIVTIKV